MSRGRIVVGGILFTFPIGGVLWQHLHYLLGLRRLGYDVTYIEVNEYYPNDYEGDEGGFPDMERVVRRVAAILDRFGFADCWHYGVKWEEQTWGITPEAADERLRVADAFINLCGSQILDERHLACPRRLLLETDPVEVQVALGQQSQEAFDFLGSHTHLFTFGENIGTPFCPLSTGGFHWKHTRQIVCMEEWDTGVPPAPNAPYTTIGNWDVVGKDITIDGRVYHWQKGLEFLKVKELPERVAAPFELAMRFGNEADRALMESHGWRTRPALDVSLDLDVYRAYIQRSRGEYTVAKEQNIVFQTGWFSDRAAAYLAAGRPVINQDTGFAHNLPTGSGLFSFRDLDDSVAAVQSIEADYGAHCRAAREIAREYFNYDRVLSQLLTEAGLEAP